MIEDVFHVLVGQSFPDVLGFSIEWYEDVVVQIICTFIGISHLVLAAYHGSKLPYIYKCETEGKDPMVAGHIVTGSTIPVKAMTLVFVIPHVVIGVSIQILTGVLWIDWTQRPRLCTALFYLVAMNSTMVLLMALNKMRHMQSIDATALNVLVLIISTVGSYCVWWLKSFLLFVIMTAALGSCSVVDYLGFKVCKRWQADEEKRKQELAERKAERVRAAAEAKKRPTSILEYRNGEPVQRDVRTIDFNKVTPSTRMRPLPQRPMQRPMQRPVVPRPGDGAANSTSAKTD